MQAFAELETDTPGQIFGVTYKTDGKSSNWTSSSSSSSSTRRSTAQNISKEFTQGPKHEEYERHDKTASGEAASDQAHNEKIFIIIGFLIFITILAYVFKSSEEKSMIERRDRAKVEQRRLNERTNEFSDA